MITETTRERRRPNIQHGEVWTVLAVVSGDGVGLPRGTKIKVIVDGEEVRLSPLSLSDWKDDPRLRPATTPHSDVAEPGPWDPEWHWEGDLIDQQDKPHRVKLGLIPGDAGLLALHVNQNGIAVILR